MDSTGNQINLNEIKDKNVLFITTKELEYLRNTQEIKLLQKNAKHLDILGYNDKKYPKRLLKIYFKILFSSFKKYDAVFLGFSPQLILPLFGWKFRKKYIMMDFFISVYDTLVFDRQKFKKNSPAGKFCKWIDTKCIRYGDYIISDTNAHGDYFAKEFQVERKKIHTLYLEADTSIYYERELEKPDNVKDKFVVLYFGSILPLQGIEVIMKAVDRLKDNKDLYFYIIGPIKKNVDKVLSDNVEYIDWLPQEKLADYINYADLCLAGHFNHKNNKAKRTIPGKAYIYEAMNKEMILGYNDANKERYCEDEKRHLVKMGDSGKLAEKILDCYEKKMKKKHNA